MYNPIGAITKTGVSLVSRLVRICFLNLHVFSGQFLMIAQVIVLLLAFHLCVHDRLSMDRLGLYFIFTWVKHTHMCGDNGISFQVIKVSAYSNSYFTWNNMLWIWKIVEITSSHFKNSSLTLHATSNSEPIYRNKLSVQK